MLTAEEISMVLNTYMYLDYREAKDGLQIKEIVSELSEFPECQVGGIHEREYTVLAKAAENPEIGELVIGNQSQYMQLDSGTNACTFSDGKDRIFVVYRGTGDGEWLDNGLGLTQEKTIQQERALQYFETVVEQNHFTKEQQIIVTGHSKGGNKAQYVTMTTKYGELMDSCINIDGQGFSNAAIERFQQTLGEEEFVKRQQKITGIFGENDFVNVLGTGIVLKENIHYIKTRGAPSNFAGYHDITYLFARQSKNPDTGKAETIFEGRKNDYVKEAGVLALYVSAISREVMQLNEKEREGCAMTLMQLMELKGEKKIGLNGEHVSGKELYSFFRIGLPLLQSKTCSKEGIRLLERIFEKKQLAAEMDGTVELFLACQEVREGIVLLSELEQELKNAETELEEIVKELPRFMSNGWFFGNEIRKEQLQLSLEKMELQRLWELLTQIVEFYQKTDDRLAEEMVL